MRLLPVISSNQNEWFKAAMRLHQASVRRDERKFLIEGTHLIEEAIATKWPLESICFEESWAEQNQSLLHRILQDAKRPRLIVQPVTMELIRRLSTTATRTRVIGIANEKRISEIERTPISLAIAIESLQDPGNLGSMIRIAAAGGASHVYLSNDSVGPTNPKVLRASAGQWFRSPPVVTDLHHFLRKQSAASIQILAASADGHSFWEADLTRPTIFLLGNEGNGLSDEMRALATKSISVPMAPGVESLNVSITASLLIYEALRQRKGSSGIGA